MPRPPQFGNKSDGGTAEKKTPKPPKLTKEGSFVGCKKIHEFDHESETTGATVAVSIHVRDRAEDKGLSKAVDTALRRGGVVKFAGGAIRVLAVPRAAGDAAADDTDTVDTPPAAAQPKGKGKARA